MVMDQIINIFEQKARVAYLTGGSMHTGREWSPDRESIRELEIVARIWREAAEILRHTASVPIIAGYMVCNPMIPRTLGTYQPAPEIKEWFYPVERKEHAESAAKTMRAELVPLYRIPEEHP